MRLSRYFLPVLKETPAEAQIVSHRLMLRAGMIRQASAGIYSWLPLGFRVLKKIEAIVQRGPGGDQCHKAGTQDPDLFLEEEPAEQCREDHRCLAKGRCLAHLVQPRGHHD